MKTKIIPKFEEMILNDEEFVKIQSREGTIQQEIITAAMREFEKRKVLIIIERLNQFGIDVDLNKQKTKRFKDFVAETFGKETTIWYREGSDTGLRVVTFIDATLEDMPNRGDCNNTFTITQQFKYY